MEAPKSVKNRVHRIVDSINKKAGPKIDFTRNLSLWQKYISQRKLEHRSEVPNNKELAEHKRHRKSISNNFNIGNPLLSKPTKNKHVRSITSYNALLETKAKNKKSEMDAQTVKDNRELKNQLSDTSKTNNQIYQNSNFTKPKIIKKLLNGCKNTKEEPIKKITTNGKVDFLNKPKKVIHPEFKRSRIGSENFKSFGETKKPAISHGIDRLKASYKDSKKQPNNEVIINNNIKIQPGNTSKENNFSGNIKISIDFCDSQNNNKKSKNLTQKKNKYENNNQPNIYKKKRSTSKRAGFFSKKYSKIQLDDPPLNKEPDSLQKAKSNCTSPTYQYYHRRMASETSLQTKKLIFNLNIDVKKQGTDQNNKPLNKKMKPMDRADAKKKTDLCKNIVSTKRNNNLRNGHHRNALSLPGTSLSSFLNNLRLPVQIESQKKVSMTPDLSATKERKSSKNKNVTKLRVSTSRSKKLIVSYSRISEEDNEDGGMESKNNSVIEKDEIKEKSKNSMKSNEMSLQSYVSQSSEDKKTVPEYKELCNTDKTYFYKLNTNLNKQRKLLITKIIEESKLSDEVPSTGLEYYHIEKLLGEGSYGKVYKATSVLSSANVAIKCYERAKIKSETACRRIMQEIEILKYTFHPHIIKLYEIFENQKYIFVVIEYIDSGDLLNYLKRNGVFEESDFLAIFKQIVRALHYLHFNGILHRDIKLDNILIDSNGQIKICDFGVSRKMPKSELVHEHIGTPAYLAPEIVSNKGYKGFKADIWSLGVMTYIALTGQVPFKGNKIEELHDSILNHKVTFDKDSELSPMMQNLIKGMLEKDPKKRLTLNEISDKLKFRIGSFERLETEYTNKEKIAKIKSLGYSYHQIEETLEKEDINHIYALYKLMDNIKGN